MNLRLLAQHIYHHYPEPVGAKVNVKVEKNSKGYNWEITITGAASVEEALVMISEADGNLNATYGASETPKAV